MAFELHSTTLSGDTPGAATTLYWYTAGPADAATRVHLQAALHADEQPGTMALHHLLPKLRDADAAGQLRAHFTIFPSVNPLGLATYALRNHVGRYDIETGVNYNRRWPDLYPQIANAIAGKLGSDPRANIQTIRTAVAAWLDSQRPASAIQQLRLLVMTSATTADIVLDLHCDDHSLKHIFTSPELMPGLQDLADWMGVAATLTAEDSGGGSFDEVLPSLYRKAQLANPDHPIPAAAETATLEYRGRADSYDSVGQADAAGLFGFFAGRGLIAADAGTTPAAAPAPTPFEATEVLRAEAPGLLAYRVELGDRVKKGQPIADLIAMDGPEAFMARQPILAGTDGFVLSMVTAKYVKRGATIAKIVGDEILPARAGGYLLED
ncbi:succinylglutamate desuccinylase/aspartoacylase family protein [Devosia neptuniae]|jgi:predicted deacylase|uniref:succinylglutamate desuccinylase/aspartoacylase family protein n=1 Tax=Devosia TaxID=46913 RepID=UPI0022AF95E0|nr:succinylglutamate desuccinylase/aspartoacylase family protein [Devosia neptuniae]MCZ4346739.1 M14 family metallopeptidase [Devosia neptuniae]|tara:strand:- start:28905 stop:30047 length:1143 start_codon:yes stop_codon:yes gene_type:complete